MPQHERPAKTQAAHQTWLLSIVVLWVQPGELAGCRQGRPAGTEALGVAQSPGAGKANPAGRTAAVAEGLVSTLPDQLTCCQAAELVLALCRC